MRRFEYFLGKLGVIAVFISVVTIAPALLAFALGFGFSLDPTVVRDTGRLLLASLAFGAIVVASAGMLMLALSSLSRNSRYVGAMWLGLWIVGNITAGVLEGTIRADWCPLVSYTNNLRRVRDALLRRRDVLGPGDEHIPGRETGRPVRGHGSVRARPWVPISGRTAAPDSTATRRDDQASARGPTRERRSPLAPATYPWQWSAGVLAGLAAVSIAVLMTRIRSLDRLR